MPAIEVSQKHAVNADMVVYKVAVSGLAELQLGDLRKFKVLYQEGSGLYIYDPDGPFSDAQDLHPEGIPAQLLRLAYYAAVQEMNNERRTNLLD